MISIAGRALIADFDGTIATLPVDWASLRGALGVQRIGDLWSDPQAPWHVVAEAEVEAARSASPVARSRSALKRARAVAILTNNSERAVDVFLARHPDLIPNLRIIVGRETLGGPKSDREIFARGFARCSAAFDVTDPQPVVYVGDQRYELELARDLGAWALDVSELEGSVESP